MIYDLFPNIYTTIFNYNIDLKTFLLKGNPESEF